MSTMGKLTRHGTITHTHTPCLVIANMVDIGKVRNRISADKILEAETSCPCREKTVAIFALCQIAQNANLT